MLAFIGRRIALAILVGMAVSLLAYLLLFMSGDPAIALAGDNARDADIERIRVLLGERSCLGIGSAEPSEFDCQDETNPKFHHAGAAKKERRLTS